MQVRLSRLEIAIANQESQRLSEYLAWGYTIRLDGRTRFELVQERPTGDLLETAKNHLWALFKDREARAAMRRLTEEAFGLYFVIDPTGMTKFRIRMSNRPPVDVLEEQSLDERSRQFHSNADHILSLGDGVQAFVGLLSAILSLRHRILLVDEPEAFLHPPLARRLGSNLANLTRQRGASLVVATHSPSFVMGCLEVQPETSVVRLTYEAGVATARTLASRELSTLLQDPLIRSTGVLAGLFHSAVVVTEGDADRAFYDEINRRLVSIGRGIVDPLFLSSTGGAGAVHKMIGNYPPPGQVGVGTA